MKLRWPLVMMSILWSVGAAAGNASQYTLDLTGEGMLFTPTLNGIPVGPAENPARSLAYSLDAFMHDGDNILVITMDRLGAAGAAGVVVSGPGTGMFGLGEGARLVVFACDPVPAAGVPACGLHETLRAVVTRRGAPDLRLWHASTSLAGSSPVDGIATSLATLTMDLASAARTGEWDRLFYLTDIRKVDMILANPSITADEAAMAALMRAAPKGGIVVMPPPSAAELTLVALPGSLWSVQRTDGAPLLRISVGAEPGQSLPDPEVFGDATERWEGGILQIRVATFGVFDGRWQLVR